MRVFFHHHRHNHRHGSHHNRPPVSCTVQTFVARIIRRCRLTVPLVGAVVSLFMAGNARADLIIPPITESLESAQPIAIVPFGWKGTAAAPPVVIEEIVASDLERSGRFLPMPRQELPAIPTTKEQVNFNDWRLLGANLVIGKTTHLPDGQYGVDFRLFDVFSGKQLTGYQFTASGDNLRTIAHRISDIIYQQLTGERGAFNTRIAYITEVETKARKKRYTLYIADSDGGRAIRVLASSQPLLSPAWAPNGQKLAYVSFEDGTSHVYIHQLAKNVAQRRRRVASFRGINGAPAWSPDGSRLALTLSKDGNAEIYVVVTATGEFTRITRNGAIDTEPAWSPDGKSLVFTSDRSGSPQIYRVPAQGGQAQRLTFEGKYNTCAAFSPDGTRLALIHGNQGAYRIGLLELDTGFLRVLTDTTLDESPSFAPNGSTILYATTDRHGSALAAVSIEGGARYRLAVQRGKVREPAWAPW
uniref:Tol-Pal system protein TolB n=1 Tax=Candidatus Kentrum sp. FM TaxID=2126340 RepID=A0A450SNT6_9GAMM|nr:MAG: TolB protein [Candidatus Kentron sp. FM]VFJ55484.1 MAG: TolB protein [Candidatus Kentron sp. FM]VFK11053.1 MAG: TolB protein [Candidatus Kentron sp. FM]